MPIIVKKYKCIVCNREYPSLEVTQKCEASHILRANTEYVTLKINDKELLYKRVTIRDR